MTVADLISTARVKGIKLAAAESCTGGMIMAALTDIAGASDVVDRGFVTYSNAAKTEMLGVRPQTLATFGAVSEEVAAEMASGAYRASGAQIAVSVTGIAGPGGSEFKPEGRVCFGLATATAIRTETVDFGALGRAGVRAAAVAHALKLISEAVEGAAT
ncbi:MAG: CinA family protein [Roseinatronobacter sp.]